MPTQTFKSRLVQGGGSAAKRRIGTAAIGLAMCGLALTSSAEPRSRQNATADRSVGYAGVWIDDTGEGAIEVESCGSALCGRIVWLKAPIDQSGSPLVDANNPDRRRQRQPICGLPIIGDLKRQRNGSWDGGWIYDPKEGKTYDVELRLRSNDQLQVTGYLGMKFLGETFIWKRAPPTLQRCTT